MKKGFRWLRFGGWFGWRSREAVAESWRRRLGWFGRFDIHEIVFRSSLGASPARMLVEAEDETSACKMVTGAGGIVLIARLNYI